jgi:hypothetical protein
MFENIPAFKTRVRIFFGDADFDITIFGYALMA